MSARPLMRGAILPHYVAAALWSSLDESDESGGEPLDANYSADDIAPETLQAMRDDCAAFFRAHRQTMREASRTRYLLRLGGREYSPAAQHAHDFWLTRNGHGAGFWDRGYGDAGQTLTEAARACGSADLYVGDDGQVQA